MSPEIAVQLINKSAQAYDVIATGQMEFAAAVAKKQTEGLIVNPSDPFELLSNAINLRAAQGPVTPPVTGS